MPLRPEKDVAIRTPRDLIRHRERTELLASMYARMDQDIADALGEDYPVPESTKGA